MNTSLSVRTGVVSPLAVGIVVVGLAAFAIIAIVRSVTTQPSDIGATTAASLTAIPWDHIPSNNLADALPAFSIQKPADATVVGVFDNQVKGVTLVEYPTPEPTPLPWLLIAYDYTRGKWVWVGAYISCAHVDPQTFIYHAPDGDPAIDIWNKLSFADQAAALEACNHE